MWTCAIGRLVRDFWSTKNHGVFVPLSLIRKGMTRNVLRVDIGVFGVFSDVQKSSTNRPVQYPCLVMESEFVVMVVALVVFHFSPLPSPPELLAN